MEQQNNVKLIKKMFSTLEKGDLQFTLDHLTEDVEWEIVAPPEVPHAGKHHGREEVVQLFKTCGDTFDCENSEIREFIAQGNKVVVLGHHRLKIKSTGQSYETDWAMYFTLRRGKIARQVYYEDTASAVRALKAA